jgi:hypothetical protein
MKTRIALLILISLALLSTLEAAKDHWVLLGRKTVNFAVERDQVPVTGHRGEFKRIQLRVKETGVHFIDLTVVFANGRRFDVPIKSFIPKGGATRIIDLPGKERVIQRIELVYQTQIGAGDPGKGLVEVWGLRD